MSANSKPDRIVQHQFTLDDPNMERLVLVAGDLEYIRSLPTDRPLTRTEVRLSASVLRRLLIDNGGELFKLWKGMSVPSSIKMTLVASNIDAPLAKWPTEWVWYALAGGAAVPGPHHAGFILASVPESEWKEWGSAERFLAQNPLPTAPETQRMELQTWLRMTSIAVKTREYGLVKVSRESVLAYAANRKGGVHFDPNRAVSTRARPGLRQKQLEAQILDWDLLRVGTLWGYEFEVVSMVHAIASADWASELVRIAQAQAPQDFLADPTTIRFWTGQKEADGTGWASLTYGS